MSKRTEENGLRIGDFLLASCSQKYYGRIVNFADNFNYGPASKTRFNEPISGCVDLEIYHPDDLIGVNDEYSIMFLEANAAAVLTLRNVPYSVNFDFLELTSQEDHREEYKPEYPSYSEPYMKATHYDTHIMIVCDTPGNGCYRCVNLFNVYRNITNASELEELHVWQRNQLMMKSVLK